MSNPEPHQNLKLTCVPLVLTFVKAAAAKRYECQNRNTSLTSKPCHACPSRYHPDHSGSLCLAPDCRGHPVLADCLQRREHAQPVCCGSRRISLPDHRTFAGSDPLHF